MDIRSLEGEDPARVLALWDEAGLPHRPRGRDEPARLREEFRREPDLALGAYEGEALVGTVLGTDDGRKGWVNRLAVAPDRRRQGVATALLDAVEGALRRRGRRIIGVLVEGWNEGSLAFFRARDYRLHDDVHYLSKRDDADA